MESLMLFLHIIAWAVAILGTLVGGFVFYKSMTYPGSLEETVDMLGGKRAVFRPFSFLIPAFIAWAFIFSF